MDILKEIWERRKIKHFTIEEVTKGKEIPRNLLVNIEETITFADKMREDLGFPISITSAYRNPIYNQMIGGVKNSLHIQFNALDLTPTSGKLSHLVKMHGYLDKNSTRLMGVGYYNLFCHIDFRGLLLRPAPKNWGTKLFS